MTALQNQMLGEAVSDAEAFSPSASDRNYGRRGSRNGCRAINPYWTQQRKHRSLQVASKRYPTDASVNQAKAMGPSPVAPQPPAQTALQNAGVQVSKRWLAPPISRTLRMRMQMQLRRLSPMQPL